MIHHHIRYFDFHWTQKVELEKVQAHSEQLQLKIDSLAIDLEKSKKQEHDLQARVEELTSDLDSR